MKALFHFLFVLSLWIPSSFVIAGNKQIELSSQIEESLTKFQVPGLAVGVVKGDKTLMLKGFGFADLEKRQQVNEDTLFQVASVTKPFTAFLVAQLVEKKMLEWDGLVSSYIPEFRYQDEENSSRVTLRHLLSHTSGMPRHDMLWYNASYHRNELLEKVAYLKSNTKPGEKCQYNNILYGFAGTVLERTLGGSWERILKSRILSPLDMKRTVTELESMKKLGNYAKPYARQKGSMVAFDHRPLITGPSSSLISSAKDLSKWLKFFMGGCNLGTLNLLKESEWTEMTSLQTVGTVDAFPSFDEKKYGLGWALAQYKGHPVVYHAGYTEGFVSLVGYLPDLQLGIILLSNTNSADFHFIANIFQLIMGNYSSIPADKDEMALQLAAYEKKKNALNALEVEKEKIASEENAEFFKPHIGIYENPAYGEVEILIVDRRPILKMRDVDFALKQNEGNLFTLFSLVPAYPHFFWSGYIDEKGLAIRLNFEPRSTPIIFKKKSPLWQKT